MSSQRISYEEALRNMHITPPPTNNNSSPSPSSSSSSASSQQPQQQRSAPKRRQKVPLAPGHTLVDWMRLCNSGRDMTGGASKGTSPALRKITPSELRKHKDEKDAWTVLNGRVYNITDYLDFHPGGKAILLRSAGKDCTKLFYATHQWVHGDQLLRACQVGVLVPEPVSSARSDDEGDEEADYESEDEEEQEEKEDDDHRTKNKPVHDDAK
ncbi:Cytochrome b5 heme-binding domain-containing protein [Balamuthia mandrillaris]